MKINVKGTNFNLTSEVCDYIEKKISSLDKFIKRQNSAVQTWVEIGKTTKHHKKGNIYRAEIQIRLPVKGIRVEAEARTVFLAINEARHELQRKLKEHKNKQISKMKTFSRRRKA
jgi:ribosomal subunit interface protein